MFAPKLVWVRRFALMAICVTALIAIGCQANRSGDQELSCLPCRPEQLLQPNGGPAYLQPNQEPCIDDCDIVECSQSPLDIADYESLQYEELTLDQCVGWALRNSKVFRDLGGTILSSPQAIDGVYDPALQASNPLFSEEAALSMFDASFTAAAFFQNNDQASNLTFQGNNGIFEQDFHDYRYTLQKLAATGTIFTVSNLFNYDNSNQTGQTLSHTWQSIVQGEFRHPLLQGAGVEFNRIAGPSTTPGEFGGVLIARTNTEISLSQFREGVRNLISDVENAYWDLYFAYRNLDATIDGRDKAYEILVATSEGQSREGSQAQAQAREQYLRFEANVLDAMEGRPNFGTRNNNGMTGGVFLSNGGVRVTERRLRLICGLPINGAQLVRPVDEPAATGVQFDWHQAVNEAFHERQELLQQRWLVKQRELQLVAAKNFLLPRFDVIGQYRFRGIGRSLTGGSVSFQDDLNAGTTDSSAFGDLYSGDFQEWQVGAEFSMPIGFRAGNLGVRNAELALSRERALLTEQKREIVYGLSNAFGELRRTFASLTAAEGQYVAAREFQFVMKLEVERGRDRDIELEAQRRVVESEIAFRRAQVEYMLALKNIHIEKGTYLHFCNVRLNESGSHPKAAQDAQERATRRGREMSYVTDSPTIARPKPEPQFSYPANNWMSSNSSNGMLMPIQTDTEPKTENISDEPDPPQDPTLDREESESSATETTFFDSRPAFNPLVPLQPSSQPNASPVESINFGDFNTTMNLTPRRSTSPQNSPVGRLLFEDSSEEGIPVASKIKSSRRQEESASKASATGFPAYR